MVVNGVIAGLPRSRVSRIGEAAPDQAAEANRHLAPLSGRQIRPSHLSRPRLHRHGAAPATGPPPATPRSPLLVPGSTGSGLQRFLRWVFEPMFSDFKSRGFGVEDTQIRYPDRLDRLLLVMSLALYQAVSTGLWDAVHHPTPGEKKAQPINPKRWPAAERRGSHAGSGASSSSCGYACLCRRSGPCS